MMERMDVLPEPDLPISRTCTATQYMTQRLVDDAERTQRGSGSREPTHFLLHGDGGGDFGPGAPSSCRALRKSERF